MPYIQNKCDCGEKFTGIERVFKVCPACGCVLKDQSLRCSCGYLFIFRRFLDKQNVPEVTKEQLYASYQTGKNDGISEAMLRSKAELDQAKQDQEAAYRAGCMVEKVKNDAEWDRFFETAQLKNTVSGDPIRSREDFYKWKREFDAAKAAREQRAKEEAARLEVARQKKESVMLPSEPCAMSIPIVSAFLISISLIPEPPV